MEELSLAAEDYEVLEKKGPYRYEIGGGRMKKGCHGQEQQYFLLRLLSPDARINVDTPGREFRSWRWVEPAEFDLRWLPVMKHKVYRAVLRDFFGVNAGGAVQTNE